MQLGRRRFLAVGALGGAALAVGGLGVALQATRLRPPPPTLRALDLRQYSVLWALAERIHPGELGFPKASEVEVALKVDRLLADAHPGFTADVGLALLAFENALGHALLDGVARPFTACTDAEQDHVLESWIRSRIALRRTIAGSLRGLCTATYYASPELWPFVGYDGPRILETP